MSNSMTRGRRGVYNIAVYLRISQEDGADTESNSIKNQREIIKSYIAGKDDFKDANLIDYVDDGISGSHTKRKAYQRLLSDIEQGGIDCVIVKDLSRIGRNMIDMDDLLMNHLVTLNVRFVAINNGYDSFTNPLSTLELSLINLANQHYNKDLAIKSVTAKNVKAKRGEYLALAPFGYKKSDKEKNKLVPDDEAAGYVKLIYSFAVEGRSTTEIAQILNDQGIPSPSAYKSGRGYKNIWSQAIDSDFCFWTNGVVRKLIMNEVYTGKAITNKLKATESGTGRTAPRPREEWIIVPNTHEPLVSEDDFAKAQLIYQRKKYDREPERVFGNKVKCPSCGHAMKRYTRLNPRFKCGTAKLTNHYGCKDYSILQSDIENIVMASIWVFIDVWFEREEIEQAHIQKNKSNVQELEKKITAENKAIGLLEASVTKLFEGFASEKMTQDVFIHKKNIINDTIERKRFNITKWSEQIRVLSDQCNAAESSIADLKPLRTIDTLNREIVDILIDKIYVHSEKEIEIIWNERFSECQA